MVYLPQCALYCLWLLITLFLYSRVQLSCWVLPFGTAQRGSVPQQFVRATYRQSQKRTIDINRCINPCLREGQPLHFPDSHFGSTNTRFGEDV